MSKYANHQNLLKQVKLNTQKTFGNNIRLFERHVGLFYRKNGSPIKINIAGMSDMYGIIKVHTFSVHIEVEVKSGTGRLSESQKRWGNFCELMGIKMFVARCPEKFIKELKEYVDELESEMITYCLQTKG